MTPRGRANEPWQTEHKSQTKEKKSTPIPIHTPNKATAMTGSTKYNNKTKYKAKYGKSPTANRHKATQRAINQHRNHLLRKVGSKTTDGAKSIVPNLPLRKHAYSKILKTLPPKKWKKKSVKKFWFFFFFFFFFFSYFCSKHRLWVLVRTASMRRF